MDKILAKLSRSQFRSRFKLARKDKEYIDKNGMDVVEQHARDFINKRIAPEKISNDGKQTPYGKHPVFIAQHATGTCCRSCILKWHNIPKDVELNTEQQNYIVEVIMAWINRQYNY